MRTLKSCRRLLADRTHTRIYRRAAITFFSLTLLFQFAAGQNLAGSIRGYKVQNTPLKISQIPLDGGGKNDIDIFVNLGTPVVKMSGLFSAEVEITGEFVPLKQSGTVDFLTFHDIRVNGIPVEVNEYAHSFAFRKRATTVLEKPARGTLRLTGITKAAIAELTGSKEEWRVTGTAFVFGKFRKFGLSFKRVVPIKLDLRVKNPLR